LVAPSASFAVACLGAVSAGHLGERFVLSRVVRFAFEDVGVREISGELVLEAEPVTDVQASTADPSPDHLADQGLAGSGWCVEKHDVVLLELFEDFVDRVELG
jgi:hypothetical protein